MSATRCVTSTSRALRVTCIAPSRVRTILTSSARKAWWPCGHVRVHSRSSLVGAARAPECACYATRYVRLLLASMLLPGLTSWQHAVLVAPSRRALLRASILCSSPVRHIRAAPRGPLYLSTDQQTDVEALLHVLARMKDACA